jgi:hypothetical protein
MEVRLEWFHHTTKFMRVYHVATACHIVTLLYFIFHHKLSLMLLSYTIKSYSHVMWVYIFLQKLDKWLFRVSVHMLSFCIFSAAGIATCYALDDRGVGVNVEVLRIPHCLYNRLTVNCERLLVAVLTVQFVPHRKHTPSPYSKVIPVTGRGGL